MKFPENSSPSGTRGTPSWSLCPEWVWTRGAECVELPSHLQFPAPSVECPDKGDSMTDNRLAGADFIRAAACMIVLGHHLSQRMSWDHDLSWMEWMRVFTQTGGF